MINHTKDSLYRLGLRSTWDANDRRELAEYNRILWEDWKADHGYPWRTRIDKIPGFLEAIENMHLSGDGLTDIATGFGLTKERIRQCFSVHGLKRNASNRTMFRIWDEGAGWFVPVSGREYIERVRKMRRKGHYYS